MSVMNTDAEDLRRYLLGQLPEEEAERMEARLLEDAELGELSDGVEEELLIEHFRGELPEGRDLAVRLSASGAGRGRIELARALAEAMPKPSPIRRYWRAALPAAAAAALVGVVVGLGLYHRPAPPPSQGVQAQAQAPVPHAVEPPPAVLSLTLITLRGAEEAIPSLALAPGQTRAELRLRLSAGETYSSCRVSLRREDGTPVRQSCQALPGLLIVTLRAEDLPAGRYEVEARGVPSQGEPEELLGEKRFDVVRSPKSQ